MTVQAILDWLAACLLLSLRITPVFVFAPPFSLVPAPASARMLLGLGISACILSGNPAAVPPGPLEAGDLIVSAAAELALGATLVMAFQLVSGVLQFAGRTIDIQAGYGLASVVDPTTQANNPLVGSLFTYVFGIVFFAGGGLGDLLHVLSGSLQIAPIGAWRSPRGLDHLTAFIASISMLSIGAAGGAILCLFLADIGITLVSRAAPQINALVLGFQVKTILLLLILPATFAVMGVAMARLARVLIEALPGFI